MELPGNEKKIQALFRELKLEDERVAPGFARVWNSAQAASQRPRRAFKISFALATALLLIALGSMALWSRNRQRGQQPNSGVAVRSIQPGSALAPPAATPEPKQLVLDETRNRARSNRWARKLAAHRQAELTARNAAIREALAISSWQSPTTTLMQSPADDVLTSLPQLNRSAAELNSFLPNTARLESQFERR
jgi:hypothetical protein